MDNEFDNSGVEQLSDPVDTAAQSPASDEYIQSEDFPWEGVEEKDASISADTSDPDPDESLARIEEAATSGQEEKTEEEKKLDDEIAKLQAENPTGLPKHLRNVASGALRGKREAEARVIELEQALEARDAQPFKPTLPVDEFVAQGKPKEFWDNLATENPAYYTPLVEDVFKTHLNPARMASDPQYVEGVMPILTDVFAQLWFPNFIQETFGLDIPSFESLLATHQAGGFQPATSFGQQTSLPAANITPQQIAEKFNLDAELDKDQIEFMSNLASVASQVPQMQKTIQQMQASQGNGTKQMEEADTNARLATFDSMITADRNTLLETALKALPRDQNGQIKKEFAHLPKKIERLVRVALDEDTNYTASRDHAKKWFKQPGNVETAKSLAGGDLKKIYGIHQNTVKQIVTEELAPYISQIRTQSQFEHTQRAHQQPKGGTSPDIQTKAPANQGGNRPADLRARAIANYQASRRGA